MPGPAVPFYDLTQSPVVEIEPLIATDLLIYEIGNTTYIEIRNNSVEIINVI